MAFKLEKRFLGIIPLPGKDLVDGDHIRGRRDFSPFSSRMSVQVIPGFLQINDGGRITSLSPTYAEGANMWRRATRIRFSARR